MDWSARCCWISSPNPILRKTCSYIFIFAWSGVRVPVTEYFDPKILVPGRYRMITSMEPRFAGSCTELLNKPFVKLLSSHMESIIAITSYSIMKTPRCLPFPQPRTEPL